MIALDTSSMKLEVLLGGAVAATEPHITACFHDVPSIKKDDFSEYRGGTKLTKTSGATPVTAVSAPPAAVTRNLRYFCLYQADSGAVTVTVRINDGTTTYTQFSQSVAAGKSLLYQPGSGDVWKVV